VNVAPVSAIVFVGEIVKVDHIQNYKNNNYDTTRN
jgi:hypothetical protein